MTDEHLDRMVRDADPYRPSIVGHLDGTAEDLLEEIMSVPTLEPVAESPPRRRRARRIVGPIAGATVAAAAVAGVLVFSGPAERAAPPAPPRTTTAVTYSALALKAAEENPRLLIDQPGWKATYVYGFAAQDGSITFDNGQRNLEMNWRPAQYYDTYHTDRLDVSKPEPVTVADRPGEVFRYSASDFAVMLAPRDETFVEMRTGGTWTRAEFDRVLADIRRVDVRTWLAALPPEIVTPERIAARAAEVLVGVPLPPGFDVESLADLGTNDAYQFGAQVTGRVGCAWIAEWERATTAGDAAARRRAGDALRGSHGWQVLRDMQAQGDWPWVFWQTVDKIVAGEPPAVYKGSIGC